MCGITGQYNFGSSAPVEASTLMKMNRALIHRGPDDEGVFLRGNIGLAMRRLSVIDLSSGHQPMSSEDGRIQLTFNGEIYNYQNLRSELQSEGIVFRTQSDTEVILKMYQKHGLDCVQYFRGMFAFAIWDQSRDRLLLARDRMGKKPLVYSLGSGRIVWSSEIPSLLLAPGISKDLDPQAIDLYLGLQYIPSPWTIYSSIRKLPPAHMLVVEKGQVRISRYWDLPKPNPNTELSLPESKQILREKIRESVRIRMKSDVPLGAFLSGGLDSTIVAGMMSQISDRPIKTFSIGFEEVEMSELKYAKEAAARFHTDHMEFIVKPDMIDVLPKLARQYGEPFGDSSALPSYYLARETRRHVTVALTGDGGDENFGGYNRYRYMKMFQALDVIPRPLRQLAAGLSSLSTGSAQRFLNNFVAAKPSARYLGLVGIFNEGEKEKLYTNDFSQKLRDQMGVDDYLERLFEHHRERSAINQLSAVDFSSYLPDCLMPKVDIATMAHSLEARSPLLDHDVVEFASRLPDAWKIEGFFSTKWILRESFKDLIPESILNRSKMGFGLPVHAWFRGPLMRFWKDTVLSSQSLQRGYFQKQYLEKLMEDHVSGKRNDGYRLWVLLMLEIWCKESSRVEPS